MDWFLYDNSFRHERVKKTIWLNMYSSMIHIPISYLYHDKTHRYEPNFVRM